MKTSVTPLYDKAQKLVRSFYRNRADIDGMTLPELKRLIKQLQLAERQLMEIRLRADKNADKAPQAVSKRRPAKRNGRRNK